MSADPAAVAFETSKFWPVAIGFFGLGTGYVVGGSQALFNSQHSKRKVEKSMALWNISAASLCQPSTPLENEILVSG